MPSVNSQIKTQFITDSKGKKLAVILPINDYEKIIEQLEDIEDVRLYDEAKKDDDGKRILFSEYLKKRNKKNG